MSREIAISSVEEGNASDRAVNNSASVKSTNAAGSNTGHFTGSLFNNSYSLNTDKMVNSQEKYLGMANPNCSSADKSQSSNVERTVDIGERNTVNAGLTAIGRGNRQIGVVGQANININFNKPANVIPEEYYENDRMIIAENRNYARDTHTNRADKQVRVNAANNNSDLQEDEFINYQFCPPWALKSFIDRPISLMGKVVSINAEQNFLTIQLDPQRTPLFTQLKLKQELR